MGAGEVVGGAAAEVGGAWGPPTGGARSGGGPPLKLPYAAAPSTVSRSRAMPEVTSAVYRDNKIVFVVFSKIKKWFW